MRWIDRNTLVATAAVALAAVVTAGEAHAQILIMRSSGPIAQRLRPGSLLPDTRPIRLAAGDTLELLGDTGTWTWRGPGDFPGAAGAVRSASVVVAPDRRRARVGAVRSVPGAPESRPNLWMVDVATPGPVCVLAEAPPLLWRLEAENAATQTLAGPDGATAEIAWAPGQAAAAWPETVPLVDGGAYRLTTGAATTSLVVKALDAAPASVPEAGMALLQEGCDAQMALLVAQMEEQDELAGS